jgi:hypothetical protein
LPDAGYISIDCILTQSLDHLNRVRGQLFQGELLQELIEFLDAHSFCNV